MLKKRKKFFGRLIEKVVDFFKSIFKKRWDEADHKILEFAILVTNDIKQGLNSGIVKTVVDTTPTDLDNDVLRITNESIGKIYADLMILKSAQQLTTEADAQKAAIELLESFGGLPDEKKEEFYTRFAAKLYILIMRVKEGKTVTFGEAAANVQDMYKAYQEMQKTPADDAPQGQ